MPQGYMVSRDILDRMRHDGCIGQPGKAKPVISVAGRCAGLC